MTKELSNSLQENILYTSNIITKNKNKKILKEKRKFLQRKKEKYKERLTRKHDSTVQLVINSQQTKNIFEAQIKPEMQLKQP